MTAKTPTNTARLILGITAMVILGTVAALVRSKPELTDWTLWEMTPLAVAICAIGATLFATWICALWRRNRE